MNTFPHFLLRLIGAVLLTAALYPPAPLRARSILEAGSATVWKYLDDATAPAAGWQGADFDDAKWKSGKAPLGYGDPGLGTEIHWGEDKAHKFITAWFRHTFEAPPLKPGEHLVLVLCVDDGAVVYLNGKELTRANMPDGAVTAQTLAARRIDETEEGFYQRWPVSAEALRPGRNVIAAEVHQTSPVSSDLYFDLALKTLPADATEPEVRAEAQPVVDTFNRKHYVGPGVKIPDGYIDGGRRMKLDAASHATSGREILLVDRAQDVELAADLAFARSPELHSLPPLERAQRLAARIDRETTPPGGMRWLEKTTEQLQKEFTSKPLLIGDWVDQCHAGVCRHRSLLFKLLADEAGLKVALVRGNYAKTGQPGVAHAWNELFLDDGRRVLVDVMHKRDQQKFPEVTTPEVVQHYLKVDNTPWYHVGNP